MNENNINIIGYYTHDIEFIYAETVMVFISNKDGSELQGYCPIGQHFNTTYEYIAQCTRITVQQYLQASSGLYTPKEYIEE